MIRLLFIFLFLSSPLWAQEESPTEVENLYKTEVGRSAILESGRTESNTAEDGRMSRTERLKSITQLETLAAFDDIAVIQRRYLPKTQRFEFYPNIGLVTNNAFFFNALGSLRLGYYLTERWSIEAIGSFFFDSQSSVTKDLKEKKSVNTQSLILPEMYYGLDLKWSPIYGKMGMFNDKIVPFDMYFSLGGGITDTNQDTTPFTIHVGTGQIFAINKWSAFRWDLSAYHYTSRTNVVVNGNNVAKDDSFTDIELTIGVSFFFPEASYR